MASPLAHASLSDAKAFLGITSQDTDAILDSCLDRASAWVDRYCGRVFVSQRYYEVKDGGGKRLVLRNQPVTQVAFVGVARDIMLTVNATNPTDVIATASVVDGALKLRRMDAAGVVWDNVLSLDTYPTSALLAAAAGGVAGFSATAGVAAPSRYLARAAGVDTRQAGASLLGYTESIGDWHLDEERGIVYGRSLDQYQSVLVDYTGGYTVIPADVVQGTLMVCGQFFRSRTRDSSVASESLGGYSYSLRSGDETSREIETLLGPYRRLR
jgi:hypothetical protein